MPKLLALGAALAVGVPFAAAQALRDPTRPPLIFGKTGDGGTGGITVGRSGNAEWVLQTVLLSPVRRYAIINGEVLTVGGSVAGAELVAIREGEVTLRTGGALRTVRLFPDVDMRREAVPQAQQPKQDAARPRAKASPGTGTAGDAARNAQDREQERTR